MFDPSFFSFGNGLFYNPMTDSVVAANTATVNTAKVKGREYDVDVANNLKNEIANQTNVLGVNHQASFSKDQDKIITDMANQLASYGVTSLADLKENKYTVEERDPFHYDDSEAPMVTVEKKEVINSKTGEVIPLNELNNSAGKGFTWYNIDFVDGQAVPYAWKEATGAGALGDQIQSIVSIPPIAAALTAGLAPTIGKELASAVVQTAATGDIGAGLKAGATSFLGGELKDVAKDLGLDNIFDFSEETVKPTTPDVVTGTDAEAQIGGFYGNSQTAEFDPRLGGTYITINGKDVFIPFNATDTVAAPIETVTSVGQQVPSLLDTIPTVLVTGKKDQPVDLLGTVQVLGTPEIPTVEVIGKRPDEPEMPTVEVIGTRPEIPTVDVIGTKPEIPTVEVIGTKPQEPEIPTVTIIGTKPEEPEMPTVTIIGTKPEEPEMPTVTVTAPKSPVEVIPVTPPPPITETPIEPTSTIDIPSINIPTVPLSAAEQQALKDYLGVDYSQLLALLSRNAGLLSPAQTYYRGLLG